MQLWRRWRPTLHVRCAEAGVGARSGAWSERRWRGDLYTGCVIIIDVFQHNGNLQRFIRDCQVIHSLNDREH